MFFGLPLDVNLKSEKFKKWRDFVIITGLSFQKNTYKKCSPLGTKGFHGKNARMIFIILPL